ncbi:MAG: hypothetical protein HYY17_15455 [Planctomycetes bacterium]|nr:hypothetical protein [Planctomycetota bacterium]
MPIARDLHVDRVNPQPPYYFQPASLTAGTTVHVQFLLINEGTIPIPNTPAFDVEFWLSDDGIMGNGGEYRLGVTRVPGPIMANQSFIAEWKGPLPSVPPGAYRVALMIDSTNAVAEHNEWNNWDLAPGTLTVLPPPKPRFPSIAKWKRPSAGMAWRNLTGRLRLHLAPKTPTFLIALNRPIPRGTPVTVLAQLPNGTALPLPASPVASTGGTQSVSVNASGFFDSLRDAAPALVAGGMFLAVSIVALLDDGEEVAREEASVDPGSGAEKMNRYAEPGKFREGRSRARLVPAPSNDLPTTGDERLGPGIVRVRVDAMLPDNGLAAGGEYYGFRVVRREGEAAWFRQLVLLQADEKGALSVLHQSRGCAPVEGVLSEWNGTTMVPRADRLSCSVEGSGEELRTEEGWTVLEIRGAAEVPVLWSQSFDSHFTIRLRVEGHTVRYRLDGAHDGLPVEIVIGSERVYRFEGAIEADVLASPMEKELATVEGSFPLP